MGAKDQQGNRALFVLVSTTMATMRVLSGFFVASLVLTLTIGTPYEEADMVVPEMDGEELEQIAASAVQATQTGGKQKQHQATSAKGKEFPPLPITCVKRKEEAVRALVSLRAAQTLQTAAAKYKVADHAAAWRTKMWHKRYIDKSSLYAFYCEQSDFTEKRISQTIRKREANQARKAALRGVQLASERRKKKLSKISAERKSKESNAKAMAQEHAQKEEIKLEAERARVARLRNLPQATKDLVGFVADSGTGQGIGGVLISVKCPLKSFSVQSGQKTVNVGKFYLPKGLTGPVGYRCMVTFSRAGFVPLSYRVMVQRGATKAIFRHGMMTKLDKTPPPYRVVLQYGSSPVDLDGHLIAMKDDGKSGFNLAEHRQGDTNLEWTTGKTTKMPFATLDHTCRTGYGPEQHTIHKLDSTMYGYYVENYVHHFTTNQEFHNSEARVFIYQGNTLIQSMAIRNALGTPSPYWQVFALKCPKKDKGKCDVQVLNTFVTTAPKSPAVDGMELEKSY